jgi:hypothetical protein
VGIKTRPLIRAMRRAAALAFVIGGVASAQMPNASAVRRPVALSPARVALADDDSTRLEPWPIAIGGAVGGVLGWAVGYYVGHCGQDNCSEQSYAHQFTGALVGAAVGATIGFVISEIGRAPASSGAR